nr:MAG TPA: hypothetical protein [Bacteriophage sp.]
MTLALLITLFNPFALELVRKAVSIPLFITPYL